MTSGAGEGSQPRFCSIMGALFGIEALYNAPGQQRGGILRAIRRGSPKLGEDSPVLTEVARGPCNTNPILSGYVVGVLVKEARSASKSETEVTQGLIERCRTILAPLTAAAGDRLFWGYVRPSLSLASLLAALFSVFEPAILYCLGYNVTQIWWRRRALAIGLKGEQAVRQELRAGRLDRASIAWGSLGRMLLGILAGFVMVEGWSRMGPAGGLLVTAAGLLGWVLTASRGISPLISAAIGLAATCALSGVLAAVLGL